MKYLFMAFFVSTAAFSGAGDGMGNGGGPSELNLSYTLLNMKEMINTCSKGVCQLTSSDQEQVLEFKNLWSTHTKKELKYYKHADFINLTSTLRCSSKVVCYNKKDKSFLVNKKFLYQQEEFVSLKEANSFLIRGFSEGISINFDMKIAERLNNYYALNTKNILLTSAGKEYITGLIDNNKVLSLFIISDSKKDITLTKIIKDQHSGDFNSLKILNVFSETETNLLVLNLETFINNKFKEITIYIPYKLEDSKYIIDSKGIEIEL